MSELSTEEWSRLFRALPNLYLVLRPDWRIVTASAAYLQATQRSLDAIAGRSLFEVFPDDPDDPSATGTTNLRASLERVLATRRADRMALQFYPVFDDESGTFVSRYWSPTNSPVLDAHGEVLLVVHRVEDVTDYVNAQQATGSSAGIDAALQSDRGATEAEVYRSAQALQQLNARLRDAGAELERRVDARTEELRSTNEALRAQIRERESAEAALRVTQEQLQQSQRLDAIGRLAGGVAHDFNNLLSIVIGFGQALLDDPALPDAFREDVRDIRDAGIRGADLTRQLLTFSRRRHGDVRVLDVDAVVEEIDALLRRVIGEDVAYRLSLGAAHAKVMIDRSQLESVVMNLVVNARDAMPDGGRLVIETSAVEIEAEYARTHLDVDPGCYVVLSVSDTGCGMDAETRARVFEPFYTTKPVGKGTGLGLSTVFGIVKQAAGAIHLYSEPGSGTTFRVYLPRSDGTPAHGVTRPAPLVGGEERILLVEDDDAVRRVARRILGDLGYSVVAASRPREALELFQQTPDAFDAVVSDVVMPEMNGVDLVTRLRALRPALPVVFASGYTGDVVMRHSMLEDDVAFVDKPLTPRGLSTALRRVLDVAHARVARPGPRTEE